MLLFYGGGLAIPKKDGIITLIKTCEAGIKLSAASKAGNRKEPRTHTKRAGGGESPVGAGQQMGR